MEYAVYRQRVNHAFDAVFGYFWHAILHAILETGEIATFGAGSLRLFFSRPFRFSELIAHMEFVGNKSVGIIILTGTFTGMALALQIYLGFSKVNATSLVGPTVALGICRELGPVLTGLIVAARAGGAMAARIGSMRVTEQIDALEVMGVDPRQYLVSPRLIAAILTMPLLTGIFDMTGIGGSYFLCIKVLDMDAALFWDRTALWLDPYHINEGLFKAAVFGLFFAVICTYRGYKTEGGASGVGSATNRGVVSSMVLIIILDYFLTNLLNMFYKLRGG